MSDVSTRPAARPPILVYRLSQAIVAETRRPENVPHRHDWQELIVLVEGRADHEIDGQELTVEAPAVLMVAQGKIHRVLPDDGVAGWVLRFGAEHVPEGAPGLFSQFLEASVLPLADGSLRRSAVALLELLEEADCANSAVRRHLLAALLALLSDEARRLAAGRSVGGEDYALLQRFLKRLDERHARDKSVESYAEALGITPKRLSALCRALFGKTTSRLIEDRSLVEARRLLIYGEDDVGAIAWALGFEDPSYFARVFRRATGLSPTDFRRRHGVSEKYRNPAEAS